MTALPRTYFAKSALAAVLVYLAMTPAQAGWFKEMYSPSMLVDGNELYQFCDFGSHAHSEAHCYGIVLGIMEMALVNSYRSQRPSPFCTPGNAKMAQAADVVLRYLRDHPEDRHLSAAHLVIEALNEAFPCRTTAAPTN